MIDWSDVKDEPDAQQGTRWREFTVRLLVPESQAGTPFDEAYKECFQADILSTMHVGKGVECQECHGTAIDTEGFPWGAKRYIRTLLQEGKDTVYCPHCDGAEDI